MSFTPVTVTHSFSDGTGAALTGAVVFKLTDQMTNGGTTVLPSDIVSELVSGTFSQSLYANDDTGTVPAAPQGAQWQALLKIDGSPQKEFTFTLPSASAPTVDLYSLFPTEQQVN